MEHGTMQMQVILDKWMGLEPKHSYCSAHLSRSIQRNDFEQKNIQINWSKVTDKKSIN